MFFKLSAFIGLIKKKKYDFIRIFVMIEITLTSVSLSGSTRNKFRGDVTALRGEVIHLGGDVTKGGRGRHDLLHCKDRGGCKLMACAD